MPTSRRLTILGTGNAALTAAYHVSLLGVDVCLYGAQGSPNPSTTSAAPAASPLLRR